MNRFLQAIGLLIVLVLSGTARSSQEDAGFVIRNVTVVDMRSPKARPGMTVVILGNRIVAVGTHPATPKGAVEIDGRGKFLIPGLWDMHAHFVSEQATRDVFFPLEIANGVTGVRDMFSDCYPDCSFNNGSTSDGVSLEQVNAWRSATAAGTLMAPRIIASSPLVDGPAAPWNGELVVRNAAEARDAVRYIKKRGNDFIKVYSYLSRDAYFAIADEAKKQGLVFAGHIPVAIDAGEASDAGQKSVEHLTGILFSASSNEAALRAKLIADKGSEMFDVDVGRRVLGSYDPAKATALFHRFTRNGTWVTPTLTVLRAYASLDDAGFMADDRLRYLPASMRADWKPEANPVLAKMTADDFGFLKARYRKQLEIVGEMHRSGVALLAGTDEPNPFCFPGFSLHDELSLFVQAGLTPFEALKTATVNPAVYLGRDPSLGTVEQGKLADLVLLDGNPLEDIGNTRRIAGVFHDGHYLSREAREKLLAGLEAAAAKH